jgi:hypothetical protein
MEKYKLSHVESLILEGDKQKQKDAKYNEMLTDLNDLVWLIEQGATIEELQERIKVSKELIKEATQI